MSRVHVPSNAHKAFEISLQRLCPHIFHKFSLNLVSCIQKIVWLVNSKFVFIETSKTNALVIHSISECDVNVYLPLSNIYSGPFFFFFLKSCTAFERLRRSARTEGSSGGRAREGVTPLLVRGVRGISPEIFFNLTCL